MGGRTPQRSGVGFPLTGEQLQPAQIESSVQRVSSLGLTCGAA